MRDRRKPSRWLPLGMVGLIALLVATLSSVPLAAAGPARTAAAPAPRSSDPAVVSLVKEKGISLAEAQQRIQWQSNAVDLDEALQTTLGERFGGVWINPPDGRVKVGVVGASRSRRAADLPVTDAVRMAAEQRQVGDAADVVPVGYSYSYLYAASEWLGDAVLKARQVGLAGLGSGLATDHNAVELDLPSDRALTAVEQALVDEAKRRYGAALLIGHYQGVPQRVSCGWISGVVSRTLLSCDPPLRGGMGIISPSFSCTTGFIARSDSDNKLFVFTAGHCITDGGPGPWSSPFYSSHHLHAVGSMHNYRDNSEGDYAILTIDNPSGWNPQAWVLVSPSTDTTYNEQYHITRDGGSSVGMRSCHSGAFGATDCGTVFQINYTPPNIPTQHLAWSKEECARKGDSGGPVYAGGVAYGLTVAANLSTCDFYYQGISAAETNMRVHIATAP
jgi:hypothetical protein